MSDSIQETVGVVGLGSMGLGMAATLAAKGFSTRGFDLAEARKALAAEADVVAVDSIADLFEQCAFIVFSLPTAKDVAGVVNDHIGILESRQDRRAIIIDTSTSEPDVSREMASRLAELGHGFLDAPVSGGPSGAAAGKLTMMLGGTDEDVALARPVIEAMAAKALHVGPSGAGNVAKLVNNLLAAAHMVTTGEGLKLAMAAGIDPEAALRVLNAASGRSMISEVHFPTWIMSDRFDSGFSMGLMRKDVRLAHELATRTGADLPLAEAVAKLWAGSENLKDTDDFTRMGAFKAASNEER
ncbi:NAD(P)-dependent oxidoreductase [Agrobacterium tumefaciens]|uniref:3-hydroxyisobutyrate dehydrogenase n=1 Tax=Agrobacterium tumefaciens TaxID=358 RepID=A0A2L2LM83_AGRTU|nr:NAD(P)-dependent oxidoreductase [Agrobacterium tumefaciens]AVH45435.1 3-hydroxyisobutyrate dehydrogenase [Agrobacterium tumefaciens]NSY99164.1 NAD(P)-dependent oxidoreductase [Agrobacterium tumefaciens]